MQQKRGGGNNWIGGVIFVVLIFGSRLFPPLANWLSQVTGQNITVPMLIGAVVVLSVVGSVAGSALRNIGRRGAGGDVRLPTQAPMLPPPVMPTARMDWPSATPTRSDSRTRLPSGEQPTFGPPRYEPIIDPRVLIFGIIGLLIFGGFFLVALLLSNSLP
jgi:hypothetical protein